MFTWQEKGTNKMKIIATAEISGTYGPEHVRIYTNEGKVFRFLAPGWHPMRADSALAACRKASSHHGFIRFVETATIGRTPRFLSTP